MFEIRPVSETMYDNGNPMDYADEEKEKSYVEMASLFERLLYEKYDNLHSSPSAVRVASSSAVIIQLVRILEKRSPIMNILLQEILKSVYSKNISSFQTINDKTITAKNASDNDTETDSEYNVPALFEELLSTDTYITKFDYLTDENAEIEYALEMLKERQNHYGINGGRTSITLLIEKLLVVRKSFGDRYQRFLKKSCFFGWRRYTRQGVFNRNFLHKRKVDKWWKRWLDAVYRHQITSQQTTIINPLEATTDTSADFFEHLDNRIHSSINSGFSGGIAPLAPMTSSRQLVGRESPLPRDRGLLTRLDSRSTAFSRSMSVSGVGNGKNLCSRFFNGVPQPWDNDDSSRDSTRSSTNSSFRSTMISAGSTIPFGLQRAAAIAAALEEKNKRKDGGVDTYITRRKKRPVTMSAYHRSGPQPQPDVKLDANLIARLMYFDGLCQRVKKQFEGLVHVTPPPTPAEPLKRTYGRVEVVVGPRMDRKLFEESMRMKMAALILNPNKQARDQNEAWQQEKAAVVGAVSHEMSTQTSAKDLLYT
jgi:hypothetical protein